jgi:predicted nucleic acid-binding protein
MDNIGIDTNIFISALLSKAADFIITYNQKDFVGIERFGLQAITPQLFLESLP